MREEKILILERGDLVVGSEKKDIKSIRPYDFKGTINPILNHGIVLFVDEDGTTNILKNRWGS